MCEISLKILCFVDGCFFVWLVLLNLGLDVWFGLVLCLLFFSWRGAGLVWWWWWFSFGGFLGGEWLGTFSSRKVNAGCECAENMNTYSKAT